nr:BspA family leucine-rich repeat surface protein [Mycoplasmopsis bovis]
MFRGATKFNQNLNWQTENITNMSACLRKLVDFNGDITKWKTGNVVDMSEMFWKASAFNKDISSWNIKKVKDVNVFSNNFELLKKKFRKLYQNRKPEHI